MSELSSAASIIPKLTIELDSCTECCNHARARCDTARVVNRCGVDRPHKQVLKGSATWTWCGIWQWYHSCHNDNVIIDNDVYVCD